MYMQTNKKKNYYLDRTYSNNAGSGTIKTKSKDNSKRSGENAYITASKSTKSNQCFNHSLISTRKTSNGYTIVVIRQPITTNKSYNLAKQFQSQARKELKIHNYFLNDYNSFLKWFAEKENTLKDNGFHKIKD